MIYSMYTFSTDSMTNNIVAFGMKEMVEMQYCMVIVKDKVITQMTGVVGIPHNTALQI